MTRRAAALVVVVAVVVAACGSTSGSVAPPIPSAPSALATAPVPASDSAQPLQTAVATSGTPTTAPPDDVMVLRYGALSERQIDIEADGQNTTAAVDGMNAFAVDLFKAVAGGQRDNLVVSPYSVTFALSMIYAGARGQTEAEMADVLHADMPSSAWHEGINAYDLSLDARTAGSPTTWVAANKVWTSPGLALVPDYLDVLTGAYGSPLAEVDFASDAPGEQSLINEWIGEQTKGLIPELFPAGSLTPQTVMVLVNAIALDAPWEFPFDPEATRDEVFTRPDGTTVVVPTMHYDEYLPTGSSDSYQAVEIPYGGGALSMVVIVPTDLAAYEAALSVESLSETIASIEDGGIHLSLPRWSIRTHLEMNDTLSALGMRSAFDAGADFSGMVEGGGVWIDRVEHEAFVQVDEEGTRAAAATGGVMVASHGPTIQVNRPFLFVIRDRGAGTILLIGRVTDPSIAP